MRKYNIPSDLIQVRTLQPIVYKQFDNGDKLEVELFQDGEKISLTNETVLAFFQLPDKTVIQKTCSVINGNAVATLDNNVLSLVGKVKVEFTIYSSNEEQTTTRSVLITVEESINRDEAIETIPQWDIVHQVLDLKGSDGQAIEEKIEILNNAVDAKYEELSAAKQVDSEVILARGGAASLGTRLNSVDQRLAETDKRIPNIANAEMSLKILNPYNNYQNIHPKVLYFPNGWNGFKYWMAYTPYPGGNTTRENPCYAVSNNGVDWTLPAGVTTSLLEDWDGVTGNYNNDTHMVYREDLNRLEVWWRMVNSTTDEIFLRRRTTTDGIAWTPTETMFTGSRTGNDHISPALIYEDSKYKMLSVNTVGSNRILNYSESVDGKAWGTRTEVIADWGTLTPWHIDFIKDNGVYEAVLQAWDIGETNNTASLYYFKSTDLINFSKPTRIIAPSRIPNKFDSAGIYRSSILKIGKVYYVYYSALNETNQRAMALSFGENILALQGLRTNLDDIKRMSYKDGSVNVIVRPNPTINHTLDIKNSNNENIYGAIKVGNLLFADGRTDGVTAQVGSVRFNGSTLYHETYNGSSWVPLVPANDLGKKFYAEKTAEQILTVGDFSTVIWDKTVFAGEFEFLNQTTLKVNKAGHYRVSIGIQISGVVDGDTIEVYVRRSGTNIRVVAREKLRPDESGIFLINAAGVFNTASTLNDIEVTIKYKGTGTPKVSSGTNQNFLLVEKL